MGANPEYAEGEVIANKYVVEGLLGESPGGRVYLANGSFGSQKIAVKFYRPEVSSRLLAAPDFFLKAGVMTGIEHDNLSACLDVQEEMGLVFVARAYAEGQSFGDWLGKSRSDGNYFPRGLELLWQVSQGLAALHERTRHLNIHPGNILVGPLVAKLCDWDPRALSNMEMTPEALPMRPEYLGYRPPEAAGRSSFLSYPSTDLFAVAGLLYRLVKGDHPHANPSQTLQEIRSFDKDLAVFLGKALHPKPEDRFQEAGAFSDALWDLQAAMQRLQERKARPTAPRPAEVRMADPLFQEPAAPSGNDTFFNFFPAADAPPASIAPKHVSPSAVTPSENKPSGDTLFGTPVFQSPSKNDFAQADPPRPGKDDFTFEPPPSRAHSSSPKSGLEELESGGTLFGAQTPLFGSFAKPKPKSEPVKPPSAKPLAVSLSSLEKDPLDMAAGDATGGFTQFGFKGAGENRTGIFNPERKAASAKAKLLIALAALGGLVLILALGGLFLYLRGTAAPKEAEPTAAPGRSPDPEAPSATVADEKPPAPSPSAAAAVASAPTAPVPMAARPVKAPTATAPSTPAAASAPDKVPDMPPIQPEPDPRAAPAKTAAASRPPGNSKVTPEREAELMAIVQSRKWPAKAAERLRAGDDLNDLGKTAEANVAYAKALEAGDANEKQKVSALGGMAVTFQAMGMHDQARDAVQQLLEINPKNAFALKLKEKLK